MVDQEKAPTLSFQCPKLWRDLPGSEAKRFCDACGHHVQNLSLMSKPDREKLLTKARTERVCGVYSQDLSGNLVTAKSELELSRKMRALRIAAITSGTIALAACSETTEPTNHPLPRNPESPGQFHTLGIMCPVDPE